MDFTEENPLSVSSVGAAVRLNNVEAVRLSIERGRSIDLKDNRGWAAIHCAARYNYIDCLNVLLQAGADLNIRTHEGETPLFLACSWNCNEAAVILLEAGCLVNLPNNEDVTPLHIVACKGFTRLASTLLNKNADVNAKDYDSDTPLMEAVRNAYPDVCRLLLSFGADQTICGSQGQLPIHLACTNGMDLILSVLLHTKQYSEEYLHKLVNWIDNTGHSPLMRAVQSFTGNLACVEELLQSGADIRKEVTKISNQTALHLAVFCGHIPVFKVILNATSIESIRECCCNTKGLICYALDSQSEECLAYLLNYGLERELLNSPHPEWDPIVYFLTNNFKFRSLEMLLERGYDPNRVSDKRCRHYLKNYLDSVGNEKAERVLKKLVDHGLKIDTYELESDDLSPFISYLFIFCIESSHFKLIPYLLQRSVVTEPDHILYYILFSNSCQMELESMSTLIEFLFHYVERTGLPRKISNPIGKPIFLVKMVNAIKFPSLKQMARSVIRNYIHSVCFSNKHQFKIKLNSLDVNLSPFLTSYLNYEEMQTLYKSLENNQTGGNV